MKKEKFIELFQDILEIEEQGVTFEDNFRDYEEWDSLAVLSVLAMINEEYDVIIPRKEFESAQTVEELFSLIQAKR